MCGLVNILYTSTNFTKAEKIFVELTKGLSLVQHRGQDACGFSIFNSNHNKFFEFKKNGLVQDVFSSFSENFSGQYALGHTRYPTQGSSKESDLQPFTRTHGQLISLAHNGNIINANVLREQFFKEGRFSISQNDGEIILQIIHDQLAKINHSKIDSLFEAVKLAMEKLDGAYSVTGWWAQNGIFGFCDPHNMRPLVLGVRENHEGNNDYCFSSETNVLHALGFKVHHHLEKGEIIFISKDGKIHQEFGMRKKTAKCMFEWVYFAGADSEVFNQSVYEKRLQLGEALGITLLKEPKFLKEQFDLVCPVPDTSRTAALKISEVTGIPYREALIKNRYIQRSFIMNSQIKRSEALELKLSPILSEITGKKILLVDDSIVRGSTSKKIISMLKNFGACEISLAIPCPPITHGCFYGIDFPYKEDLVASRFHSLDEIQEYLGAKAIFYLSYEKFIDVVGNGMCTGCLTGKYPTTIKSVDQFVNQRRIDHFEEARI